MGEKETYNKIIKQNRKSMAMRVKKQNEKKVRKRSKE
jgi:hypothetical protein